jgi:hypothetical protein
LSFASGIAGDLSIAAPPAPSVVVHLPPPMQIPADAIRAHPLPPLTAASAHAEPAVAHVGATHRVRHLHLDQVVARAKPETREAVGMAKVDPDRAPKHDGQEVTQV